MNVLAFTDCHGYEQAFKSVERLAKKADFCVCSGDISMFEQKLENHIKRLDRFGKPVFIIPGNHEGASTLRKICEEYKNVRYAHAKVIPFDDFLIIGFGTSGFSLIDEEFERFVEKRLEEIDKNKKVIFLSHAPPFNTRLDRLGKSNVGNKSVRRFIKAHQPDIVVCGHLHENFGKRDKIGKTIFLNPGPFGTLID